MPTANPGRDPVFADSFVLIALLNPSDAFHEAAKAAIQGLAATLVTTHWILIEVTDALSAPPYRAEVARFLRELAADAGVEVIAPEITWYERGLELYARRPDKGLSLTDCVSFVVMADRGAVAALTAAHHFEQAGFRALMRLPSAPR